MIRNLKTMGLALAAVLALGAVGATSASAQNPVDHIESDIEQTVLTGTGTDHVFEVTDRPVDFKCATSKFSATMAEALMSGLTVFATYTGTPESQEEHDSTHCSSAIGTVHIDMNGCDYLLTGETNREHNGGKEAEMHIDCPPDQEIKFTGSSSCDIDIPEQTPTAGGVRYTNTTGGGTETVTLDITITGITYTSTGFSCALAGIPSEANDLDYTGTVEMVGFEDEHEGAPHRGDEFTDGGPTNIRAIKTE